ncbi:hypothetical protein DOTSEDRAFT_65358 [Dothistroma septosporum NZE10]|uniref:Mid2 domain-containing protein n=1 Tax=Dothistroma septosporum (strain NZE10 / CBS 128990) TaxID=675120 RepID=N1PGQ2_DOTSN|nr:hypothetical protein DOTSEDRAFT_65358 [Dothistroma septosporum NZE10]
MTFFTSFSRALAAAVLLTRLSTAQQCYFPDGTPSTDIPCGSSGQSSSCCGSDEFCMDNGLCFGGGLVSRGSCTDRTWASQACSGYCKTTDASGSVPIMPCSSNGGSTLYVCGINSTLCKDSASQFTISGGSFVLRPSQVQALIGPALNSMAAEDAKLYTGGQMAGLGCGLGLPLLFCICAAFFMWQRERNARPKLMYKLPDGHNEFGGFKAPPPMTSPSSGLRPPSFGSYQGSVHVAQTSRPGTPAYMQNYLERYQAAMHEKTGTSVKINVQPVEIGGTPIPMQRQGLTQHGRGSHDVRRPAP